MRPGAVAVPRTEGSERRRGDQTTRRRLTRRWSIVGVPSPGRTKRRLDAARLRSGRIAGRREITQRRPIEIGASQRRGDELRRRVQYEPVRAKSSIVAARRALSVAQTTNPVSRFRVPGVIDAVSLPEVFSRFSACPLFVPRPHAAAWTAGIPGPISTRDQKITNVATRPSLTPSVRTVSGLPSLKISFHRLTSTDPRHRSSSGRSSCPRRRRDA